MEAIALPQELKRFEGKITDIDTHEMMPAQVWVEKFGPDVQFLADYFIKHGEGEDEHLNTTNVVGFEGDILPIDKDVVNIKGSRAPGSVEPERRLDVMDAMGISRQLMYPTGHTMRAINILRFRERPGFMPGVEGDRIAMAKRAIDLFNAWAIEVQKTSDRIRPVAVLYGDTPEELIARVRHFVDNGIRAVWIFPAGEPLGGRSPAHPDLDPMWAALAEANCAATIHVAGDGKFFASDVWRDAPAFEGFVQHVEISRDPWFLATLHKAFENFLTVMILGGVFDRHPTLRFGVIECAAHWVGPMIRRLDMFNKLNNNLASKDQSHFTKELYRLPHPPSFYLKRNVRVTPFVFEDFAFDIKNYGLEDVLAFSTDYPHVEGGRNAAKTFYDKVSVLGEEVTEKFFVTNGQLLLPD